ncbi:MAG: acetyl-CoA carboxylase carboxyl transferase subunit alpha [Lachnospiraceae bacterium]|jgi:acetyl-CoA carboxylase carboxyl transferase subunit alpha|nr:acetyl-CoA carboxylase carboxyl transferase subunit alpha [Lachnospiraceae bacterium]MCH4030209.1 acetyl-CoA carboxylase carboxyl transferase subunit alpha [Lachnospiraceae bacterium]MCH4069421.1 acetyl-CoA carboxylase carboxyl transferase subunit alpha [Lachnospiraceae bacterium]MCH4107643.1 acetyl-CoA carboxylase carboxyl transferase subunit alpha [Lachnospiraceae bacterium]MCI1301506.1 acetyl-CoA carboxylase carboxyl transferase subunit alpha [Lachnospiraceae bacterium]
MNRTVSGAYAKVEAARNSARPTGIDYISNVFSSFIELHGDRRGGDDPSLVGGLAYLERQPVTVLAIEKGHTAKQRQARSFGSVHPEGYRKALRLMRQAQKFHRPVICLVDTAGAGCGLADEQHGIGQAIAENLTELAGLSVPVISILISEGGSGGALALALTDEVWMLKGSYYSVISPEGCAQILWKDPARTSEAAACLHLTADDALKLKVADRIIPETDLGKKPFYDNLRGSLASELERLGKDPELTEKRYARFRRFGDFAADDGAF